MRVSIVGSGLLGTSLGLALSRQGHEIFMEDLDPARAALAADLVGGSVGERESDISFIAVPTNAIAEVVLARIQTNMSRIVSDLGSVKTKPLLDISSVLPANDLSRYVPGHPMAGRERSGPEAARADLFTGRPWILTPVEVTSAEAVALVRDLIERVGATAMVMSAQEHDQAVALISHLPQLVSSVVAGMLGDHSAEALALAGQGVKDLTRIAGSSPELWTGIIGANASAISPLWDQLMEEMESVRRSLESFDSKSIYQVIDRGNQGRSRLPGKHGGLSTNFAIIPVVVDDRPGQLGSLFAAAAQCGVNIEDLSMEHTPGQLTGLVELAVAPEAADGFIDFLKGVGWRVHQSRRQSDPTIES